MADNGINPLEHYVRSGAFEGRDPDAAFDSSFYLAEYTDVTDANVNPLEHYASSGSDEGRFANAVFQSFESKEAWAISSNIGESEFEVFKDAAFSVVSTDGETEVAAIPFLIPLIYEGIKIIGIGLLSAEILNRVNNIQQLLDDDSANILWIPDSDEKISSRL